MRLTAVLVVALGALAALLVPSPTDSPLGRVASIDADGRDPLWDAPVDGVAVRRAGALVPDDARYFVWAPGASPLLQGNLKAAAQLYFAPALPVQDPVAADWVLSYRATPTLPARVGATDERSVGARIFLIRVRQ